MSATPQEKAPSGGAAANCLARSVTRVFGEEPSVEAITVNRARKTISVATLGQVDVPRIERRITATLEQAQTGAENPCGLLSGRGDCLVCATPLSAQERQSFTIRNEGDSTTIARVTCPTAPRFWRWRDLPWPKVVQRDVEFIEHSSVVRRFWSWGLFLQRDTGGTLPVSGGVPGGRLVHGTGGLGTAAQAFH
jgi:hypothetical protein